MEQQSKRRSLVLKRMFAGLAGLLFFIPAFLVSFAVACIWAEHRWPGDGPAYIAAFDPAVIVAAILTIICCIYLVRKVGAGDEGYWPRKPE